MGDVGGVQVQHDSGWAAWRAIDVEIRQQTVQASPSSDLWIASRAATSSSRVQRCSYQPAARPVALAAEQTSSGSERNCLVVQSS